MGVESNASSSNHVVVLASASPRRHDILKQLGIAFEAVVANVDESNHACLAAVDYVCVTAKAKACKVAQFMPGRFVLAADTCVAVGEEQDVLVKPSTTDDALAMLRRLAGSMHHVHTGVCLMRDASVLESCVVSTKVWFRELSDNELHRYVLTGEGVGKAGAYAIQGVGAGLVECIEGSYSNVVGLCAATTVRMLVQHGVIHAWPLPQATQGACSVDEVGA